MLPTDENNFVPRLTNRDIITAELRNKNTQHDSHRVTNQQFISNQLNRSALDVTSEYAPIIFFQCRV